MDEMVQAVQKWLNSTYVNKTGYTRISEDGITGGATIKALIIALQIEIGINSPDGIFGPTTMSLCPTLSTTSTAHNKTKILQGALYCKGYNPTGFTGTYGNGTKAAIAKFQSDAGLSNQNGITTPVIFKALLNMDAFVNIGDPKIRSIQQSLNRNYSKIYGTKLGLIPCDGIYSRYTNKALIYALQVEQGNTSPDGIFGPTTMSLCPTLSIGSTKTKFVLLLRYGLYVNGYDPLGFDGIYDNGLKSVVTNFQKFSALSADGIAGKQTWASLLVSTGDKTRKETACDCVTTITPARAQTLKNNGYTTIGRYIVMDWKKIKEGELQTIFSAGLKVFPIYQTSGNNVNYFSAEQGAKDAIAAVAAANSYGFGSGTIIYFAVDFDALDGQVTSHILPYFQALSNKMKAMGGKYRIGIYGPRNVCIRVGTAGYSCASFVSDMSTGFSGNIGYSLPKDWAFDQIATITIGSGEGAIEIDNNIQSQRDPGVGRVYPPTVLPIDDSYLLSEYKPTLRNELIALAEEQITVKQKLKALRSRAEAVDIVLENDNLITNLSRTYSMRKAMIQAVLLRELYTYGADDPIADNLVIAHYAFKVQYEAWDALPPAVKLITPPPEMPIPIKTDCSTGYGQIFAATAIDSINYAINSDIIAGKDI